MSPSIRRLAPASAIAGAFVLSVAATLAGRCPEFDCARRSGHQERDGDDGFTWHDPAWQRLGA